MRESEWDFALGEVERVISPSLTSISRNKRNEEAVVMVVVGPLVESTNIVRRVAGSNHALATT